MDTNAIILALAGLVVFGLIYRSASSKPEKTTGGGSSPSPSPSPVPNQEELMALTRAQLVEIAEGLGATVPKSHSKTKIVQGIINLSNPN
jgi:hypothetical protein